MVALSIDFSSLTGTIQASQFHANFTDLNGKFGNIFGSDIHPRAGISAGQLRDRYSAHPNEFNLIPLEQDATIDGAGVYTFPAAMTLKKRRRVKCTGNQLSYLASVEIYNLITSVGAAPWPRVEIRKNGVLITGAQYDLGNPGGVDDSFYTNERTTDPLAVPAYTFANNDIIEYWIGSSTGAGAPTCLGVWVTEWWKNILIP